MAAGLATAKIAADALGISRQYLLMIESGRGSPGPALMQRMTKTYGLSEEQLAHILHNTRTELWRRQLASARNTA
jgi:transcriptional regulator with XRE-family HTH domain